MSLLKGTVGRIIVISTIATLVMIDLFVNIPQYNNLVKILLNWGVVVAGFMLFQGAVYVSMAQIKHISNKTSGQWYYSLWLILIMIVTFFTGVLAINYMSMKDIYSMINTRIFPSLESAAYATIAFYYGSSIFRTFRSRNVYTGIFLVVALFMYFENAPIGYFINPALPAIAAWIQKVPNVGGMSGIIIGSAIGIIASGIRTMLGYERGGIGG